MDFAAPMLPESGPGPGGSGVMWQEVTGVKLTRRKGIGFGYLARCNSNSNSKSGGGG